MNCTGKDMQSTLFPQMCPIVLDIMFTNKKFYNDLLDIKHRRHFYGGLYFSKVSCIFLVLYLK